MARQQVLLRAGWRYTKTIGGADDGKYHNPWDLSLRDDGMMAVLCRQQLDHAKIVLNTFDDEEYLGEFGEVGTDVGQLARPTCLAFGRDGLLYIADELTNRVNAFTIDPREVAANGGPQVILRRGQLVEQSAKFVSHWGTTGRGDGELNGPSSMVFDPDDNLYVVDHRNSRVQKFTRDGRFLAKWGRHGDGEGEFDLPWGITLDHDGNVYVADWRNDRVQKFTADGEFLALFGSSGSEIGQFNRPTGVAVDMDGDIYVADWRNDRVQVLAHDGRFVDVFYGDSTLSKWILELSAAFPGQQGQLKKKFMSQDAYREKYFRRPVSIKLTDEGHVLVADNQRFRVQVYLKEAYPSLVLMEVDLEEEPILI